MAKEYENEFRVKPLTSEIIDIFEDFLDNRDIRIPSSDAQMKEDGEFEGNDAIIYGEDYYGLSDNVSEAIARALRTTFENTIIDTDKW